MDLLKREGVCSENAPHYVEVLDQKSQRLKGLTEDLFEAAKASSGNLAYTLERLDMAELLSQGMGELSDRIAESGLQFRQSAPEEKVYALGDGRLLWRVMENLLSNVFKYAQPGSRVYLETGVENGWVRITLKNISAFELNIQAEELLERFKRGTNPDTARGPAWGSPSPGVSRSCREAGSRSPLTETSSRPRWSCPWRKGLLKRNRKALRIKQDAMDSYAKSSLQTGLRGTSVYLDLTGGLQPGPAAPAHQG